jgi:CheY-like chemotaxis protein
MNRRALVVDDDAGMRLLAVTSLRLEGWQVVGEASNGYAAIDAAVETHPDLIVLDHLMPQLSGGDALPVLRRLCPEATIVLWTTAPELARMARAHRACVADKSVDALIASLPD